MPRRIEAANFSASSGLQTYDRWKFGSRTFPELASLMSVARVRVAWSIDILGSLT